MDVVAQIKNNLISRIKKSDDINFLQALQSILDNSDAKELFQLSLEQEIAISDGRNQLKNGQFSNNDDVISELKEWISKK